MSEFNGKGSGTIAAALSRPPFDDDILAFDVSLIPQTVTNRSWHGLRELGTSQHADGSRPGRLLRLSGERSGEEATSEGAHEGPPVHHSIT